MAKIGVSYSFCYVIDKKEAIIGKKVGEIFGGSKKGSTFAFVNVTQEKGQFLASFFIHIYRDTKIRYLEEKELHKNSVFPCLCVLIL